MKDIQAEVNALELAIKVATDIKDKPYAYAVIRIQQAIMDKNSEVERGVNPEPLPPIDRRRDGWKLSAGRDVSLGLTFNVVNPEGVTCLYQIAYGAEHLEKIIESFNDCLLIRNVHLVQIGGGKWYFRDFSHEVSLASVHASTLGEQILMNLRNYIEHSKRPSK